MADVKDERRKFMESIVDIARTEREMLHCQSFDDIAEVLIDFSDRLAASDKQIAKLRDLLGEARGMVAMADATGIRPGIVEWLTMVDDARKVHQ